MNSNISLKSQPRVTILIPCWNEEAGIERNIVSCLNQTIKIHQIIVVDDSSTDRTPEILAKYADKITVVKTPQNLGNKSHAQQYGLQFVTGDILVTTDADTEFHPHFVAEILKEFQDPQVAAAGGYVKSRQYNWLTRCRAFEYSIGQNLHKLAQSYMNFMFVIPGAAGAFRTEIFKTYLTFDHDTITEDLDFTYKLHKNNFKINYNRNAIVYTQDPPNLHSYINQMRRWYGGGWQNLIKHLDIAARPIQALELSTLYIEGMVFSLMLFLIPLLNLQFFFRFLGVYFVIALVMALFTAIKERRADLLIAPIPYTVLMFINAYIFLEQFVKEVIFKQKNLVWFKPERVYV